MEISIRLIICDSHFREKAFPRRIHHLLSLNYPSVLREKEYTLIFDDIFIQFMGPTHTEKKVYINLSFKI